MDVKDEFPFLVLSTDECVRLMTETIEEVNDIIDIPPTITKILLNHVKWDKQRLYDRYFDGNQDRLFKEAHVISPSENRSDSKAEEKSLQPAAPSMKDCEICLQNLPSSMMAGLACGHRFCTECWSSYITTKIVAEGMCQTISCASHNCDILVDDQTVMQLIEDPNVKLKYQHLITNSFVDSNRFMRWCPQPDCNNVIKVQYVDTQPVTCSCSHTFCFSCGENWHDPIKCHLLKKWLKKLDQESGTSNYIAANTKECPKCNVAIEMVGGCNHVVCQNEICKAVFCWVCLRPWELHVASSVHCRMDNEAETEAARDAQEPLQRYALYSNRYLNHTVRLKFENKLYAVVKQKMEGKQQLYMAWTDLQLVKKALNVLCQCRQSLMYSYAFAFYLSENNESVIFEGNQAYLESSTDKLSEFLVRAIRSDNLVDVRQKVLDECNYCESRRRVLVEHVHEVYEKDGWEYTE